MNILIIMKIVIYKDDSTKLNEVLYEVYNKCIEYFIDEDECHCNKENNKKSYYNEES